MDGDDSLPRVGVMALRSLPRFLQSKGGGAGEGLPRSLAGYAVLPVVWRAVSSKLRSLLINVLIIYLQ